MDKIHDKAVEILDEIISIRRDIHQHPEISGEEERTAALVRAKLQEFGVDEILSPAANSVVGIIRGSKPVDTEASPVTVALRADMDALPVEEDTGLEFASLIKGKMHACGHDLHTSMLLGAAKILCGMRDGFCGTVKLIFQHSEEKHPGGAMAIVESGVLGDVDAFFGMHVYPSENDRVGTVLLMKGPVTTSVDEITITVHGKAGHGSMPHRNVDSILAACTVNVLMSQIQARSIDPLDTCILGMNMISGGVANNVIAGEARMSGYSRAYTEETRQVTHQKIRDICKAVDVMSGTNTDIEIGQGYDACCNSPELVDLIMGPCGAEQMEEPVTFSEDFSFYSSMTGKPSAFMFLLAGHGEELVTLHSPKCVFHEEAMPNGIAAMTNAALAFLNSKY